MAEIRDKRMHATPITSGESAHHNLIELINVNRGNWQQHAHCSNTPRDDIFFASRMSKEIRAAAEELCTPCPVRQQCAQLALTTVRTVGLWAGVVLPYNQNTDTRYSRSHALDQLHAIAYPEPEQETA